MGSDIDKNTHGILARRTWVYDTLVLIIVLGLASPAALAASMAGRETANNAAQTLVLIETWLGGTYDNSAQIAVEVAAGVSEDEQGMRLHQVITPVTLAGFEELTFFSQLTNDGTVDTLLAVGLYEFYVAPDGDSVVMRLRMFNDTARFTDAHLEPERLRDATLDDVHWTEGCEFYLSVSEDGTRVEGAMKERSCFPVSRRTGEKIMHVDELIIKPGEFWNDARYYDLDGNQLFGNTSGDYQKQIRIAPYRLETLVAGGPLHGAKGIAFGRDDRLYVCSVYAQSVFRVNVHTGEVTTAVAAPDGESDDVAFAPDGTMAWTALPSGEIRARRPGGEVFVVASGLPLINPLRFTNDGRLFAAQIGIDRFLEIDIEAKQPPRLVAKGIGHLNSFVITDDHQVYGPLAGINTVARIDIDTGAVTPIAENLGTVSAVKLNSRGEIFAVGWSSGELMRIDADTGAVEVITVIDPPLDNLAIDSDDMIYVSQPARGAIVRVDPITGKQTDAVGGNLSVPGGLAMTQWKGRETLVMADDFAFRLVDTETGEVSAITDLAEFMDPSSATDVAVNDEVIVLSDVTRSRVYMIDRDSGEKILQWKKVGTPYGLALLDSGDPVVADFSSGQLIRLSREDRKAREVITSELSGPVGVARAGPDALYVTEAIAGRVTRINIEDGSKVTIRDGLNQPEGLAVLPDGRVAVVEAGAGRISAIDPETGSSQLLAADLPIGLVVPNTPAPVHVPSGIAIGENGILYLTSDRDHSVIKLVPAN